MADLGDSNVSLLTFENSSVAPANRPQLSCTAANQLTLAVSSLRLGNEREIFFSDSGKIRSLDDNHQLFFNRLTSTLELHEQGSISFLTGGPPPVERMRILDTGNVGIGTTSPVGLLHVKGTNPVRILGETSTLSGSESVDFFARSSLFSSDLGGLRIQRQAPTGNIDTMIFAAPNGASATEVLRASGNGNVGIGTTTPAAKLQVVGGAIMPAIGNSREAGIQFPLDPGGGAGDEAFIRYFAEPGTEKTKLLIGVENDLTDERFIDTIGFWQAGAERVTIAKGKLGIGTSMPQQTLHVDGEEVLSTGEAAGFKFRDRGSASSSDDWVWYSAGNLARFFRAGVGDLLSVTTSGNVGIGTTSPAGKLDVNGDIRAGNSDLYFTKTDHNHTGIGNTPGFAAIENAANFGALMILGRAGTGLGRTVKLWDYLEVNGRLDVTSEIRVGNSDIYFTKTNHNHTGIGNTTGFAAIENAANFGALMILGRSTPGGRIVQLWDHVQVRNGNITVQGKIGTNGLPATPKKNGWGGGIRTWDVEAEGTIWSAHGLDTSPHDLAENYYSDQTLEPGDVVCLDRARDRIVMSTEPNDCLTLGIISTKPGLLLNADHEEERAGMVPVALSGRVPCKVTNENGPIQRGDLLTTSSTPGHAMKAKPVLVNGVEIYRPGTIIGKALEPHEWKDGVIETFVCLR